jgi:hypothetical protein
MGQMANVIFFLFFLFSFLLFDLASLDYISIFSYFYILVRHLALRRLKGKKVVCLLESSYRLKNYG